MLMIKELSKNPAVCKLTDQLPQPSDETYVIFSPNMLQASVVASLPA
jgi:hypothetical protein